MTDPSDEPEGNELADEESEDGVEPDPAAAGEPAPTETEEQAERFTEGTLLWPLLTLAAPLIASQLLQTLYNITDTFWVGQVGGDAVTAISFAWPIVFLLIGVGGGMTAAGTILVSQHTGARDDDAVSHVAGQTIAFVFLLSVAMSIIGYVIAPTLLALLGAEPGGEIHAMATEYTRITFLGLWFMLGFFVFQALLRGWGDTKTPMYLMAGSVALNVVLDPFLILGFGDNPLLVWLGLEGLDAWLLETTGFTGWGVAGAAVATVGSRGLAAAAGMWLLFSGWVGISLGLADLRLELQTVRKIVRVGAPISVEQSTQALSITVMTGLLGFVGSAAVGGYGIGARFGTLVWMPMVGMGMAVETVVGQNVGAARRDRARRTVLIASSILVSTFLVVGALSAIYAEPIVELFVTGEDADAIVEQGADNLRWTAPTWAVMAIFHMINGALHGAGATRLSMGLGVVTLWGARVGIAAALILWIGIGATGAWIGIAASNVLAALAATAVFAWDGWLGSVVEEEPAVAATGTEAPAAEEATVD